MRKIAVVLAFMACGSHGWRLQTRSKQSLAENKSPLKLSDTVKGAQAQAELDEPRRHLPGKRALNSVQALAALLQAFNLPVRPAAGVRSVTVAPSPATTGRHLAVGKPSTHFSGSNLIALRRSGNICMGMPISRWIELVGTAAFVYFAWMRRPKKTDPNVGGEQGDRANIAATAEEEYELHEFCCQECGYTIFPARNRQEKFFTSEKDYECPMCGAPKTAFFDMTDYSDPRTVKALQDDPDFEYEIIEVEVSETDSRGTGKVLERGVDVEIAEDPATAGTALADAMADDDEEVIDLEDEEVIDLEDEDAAAAPADNLSAENATTPETKEPAAPPASSAVEVTADVKEDVADSVTVASAATVDEVSVDAPAAKADVKDEAADPATVDEVSSDAPAAKDAKGMTFSDLEKEDDVGEAAKPEVLADEDGLDAFSDVFGEEAESADPAAKESPSKDPAPEGKSKFDPLKNDLLKGSSL